MWEITSCGWRARPTFAAGCSISSCFKMVAPSFVMVTSPISSTYCCNNQPGSSNLVNFEPAFCQGPRAQGCSSRHWRLQARQSLQKYEFNLIGGANVPTYCSACEHLGLHKQTWDAMTQTIPTAIPVVRSPSIASIDMVMDLSTQTLVNNYDFFWNNYSPVKAKGIFQNVMLGIKPPK